MRYPTREYQHDSPSDLLLRRPQGIKPKKKIVKIRDSGLTRKVISASTEHRIDAYLLVRTTFHSRSSSTRLEGHSGSMLRIWRRYASGSIPFRRQVPAFPATSRNLSAEAGIRGKNALPGHESPGHWSSNQSRFSQHGTNIFGEKLVTGSWSAQRVSNQCS